MGREEKTKAKSAEPNQQVLGSDTVCMGLYPEDAGSREVVQISQFSVREVRIYRY